MTIAYSSIQTALSLVAAGDKGISGVLTGTHNTAHLDTADKHGQDGSHRLVYIISKQFCIIINFKKNIGRSFLYLTRSKWLNCWNTVARIIYYKLIPIVAMHRSQDRFRQNYSQTKLLFINLWLYWQQRARNRHCNGECIVNSDLPETDLAGCSPWPFYWHPAIFIFQN